MLLEVPPENISQREAKNTRHISTHLYRNKKKQREDDDQHAGVIERTDIHMTNTREENIDKLGLILVRQRGVVRFRFYVMILKLKKKFAAGEFLF